MPFGAHSKRSFGSGDCTISYASFLDQILYKTLLWLHISFNWIFTYERLNLIEETLIQWIFFIVNRMNKSYVCWNLLSMNWALNWFVINLILSKKFVILSQKKSLHLKKTFEEFYEFYLLFNWLLKTVSILQV